MMPLFRTQVSPMNRERCYSRSCVIAASYTYTDAAKREVHACVRHDLDISERLAPVLQAEVIDVTVEV